MKRISSVGNFQFGLGYTLIEILVVMAIVLLLTGAGLAAYNSFNEKQGLKGGGSQLYNDLRLAQSKANNNEKPTGCSGKVLEGYKLQYVTGNPSVDYEIVALCSGTNVNVGISRKLPEGVAKEPDGSVSPSDRCGISATFYILAGGAVGADFCLSRYERYYKVTVSDTGEVVDLGFVTEAEIEAPTDCNGYCKYFTDLYKKGVCRSKPSKCRSNEVYDANGECSGTQACCCKKL